MRSDTERNWPRFYIANSVHRTNTGVRMLLHDRPWAIDIYRDNSDYIVGRKCSQIGFTEFAICDMMALAKRGVAGLYVLPTDVWRSTFVPNRIDRAIEYTDQYKNSVKAVRKDVDSRVMKSLYGVNWKFVGANVRNNFYEFPAGAIIIDEFDLCDQGNLTFAEDRLRACANPVHRKFGNPTVSDYGIDKEYNDTDAKHWLIRCPACNTEQVLDWFANVVEKDGASWVLRSNILSSLETGGVDSPVLCRQCNKPMNRLSDGRWVAEHPGNAKSGYTISALFADVRRGPVINELFKEFIAAQNNPIKLQRFFNNLLGIPYEHSGAKITAQALESCRGELPMAFASDTPTFAGVDIGLGLHYSIGAIDNGRRRTVAFGVASDYEDLGSTFHRFNVRVAVLDAGPEIHEPRAFARSRSGVYLCRYNINDKMQQGKAYSHGDMDVNFVSRSVSVNRTESLDRTHADYANQLAILPSDYAVHDGGAFVKQMTVPTRIREDRDDGTFRYIWTKGVDHYRHADNYAAIAGRLFAGGTIQVATL